MHTKTIKGEVLIMRPIGVVRKLDKLGRLVIPKELRREMDIDKGSVLEIFVDKNAIILRKYKPFCVFCESTDNLITYKGQNVCKSCFSEMKQALKNNGADAKSFEKAKNLTDDQNND